MSKTGETKKRILELLKQKNGTLTDISNKLEIAPSTVSQHLQEMVDSGMIKQVDDRPRKWKYYEINRNYAQNNVGFSMNKYVLPIVVVLIVAVLAGGFYLTRGPVGSSTIPVTSGSAQQINLAAGSVVPQGSTVFTISDAPPAYNISALFVTVDSAEIHSATAGKWYTIPLQTSTFNLIQLKNVSKVLSGVKLSNGVYDQIVLQISNVTAVVNGTGQSVYLPNNMLDITGKFNISNNNTNSTDWINIDFNLENSLHLLPKGGMVMLPVLFVRHLSDGNLNINQNALVVANAPGRIREYSEFGMNAGGMLVSNYTTPQNTSLEASGNGQFRENGPGSTPIIIRSTNGLFIGGDATRLIGISSNNGTSANATAGASTFGESTAIIVRKCFDYPCCVLTPNGATPASAAAPISKNCCGYYAQPATATTNILTNRTAYPCCYNPCCTTNGILPPTGANGIQPQTTNNGIANSIAYGRCCYYQSANGIGTGALTNANSTNETAGPCCNWGVMIPLTGGAPYRKCVPMGGPISVTPPIPIGIKGNVSANELNWGTSINWIRNSSVPRSTISIVISNRSGNLTANCSVENGALRCESGNGTTRVIISRIGSSSVGLNTK